MDFGVLYAALYLLLFVISAAIIAATLLVPYVLLRRTAKTENWKTPITHTYLPWLATMLAILGIFGIG